MASTYNQTHEQSDSLIEGVGPSGEFGVTIQDLGWLFHQDNIEHVTMDGAPVSMSVHRYWKEMGGSEGIARALNTDLRRGVIGTAQDLELRKKVYGSNKKRIPKIRTLFELIKEAISDRTLIFLLILGTINVIIQTIQHPKIGWIDGVAIYGAVALIVGIQAQNNYSKEKQLQKLVCSASVEKIAAFRGNEGLTTTIDVPELVVGDIIKIEQGMRVPADCILIEGIDIETDESAMTGEIEAVPKQGITDINYESNPNPFLIGKTLVNSGQGIALVCCVGTNTRSGMAEELLQTEEEQTPLQQKLDAIANQLAKVGFYFFLLALALGCGRTIYDRTVGDKQWDGSTMTDFLFAIITAVTVIVIAIPEGLPLAVTISFAFSVMKMKKEKNWVRKLASSETMGGADQICTDKTGTLTKNQMTVRQFYSMESIFNERPSNFRSLQTADLLAEGVLYNCSARIEKLDGVETPAGNVTEQGLLRFLMDLKVPCLNLLLEKNQHILHLIPFNSTRKRAATCIRHPSNPKLIRAFCKGAPEIVLQYVNKMFDKNGEVVYIDQAKKDEIQKKIVGETFAVKAYRTLLIAYADYTEEEYLRLKAQHNNFEKESDREALEQNLTLIGIYALQDPLRDEVKRSVRICHKAGINVRMVTGDNIDTAKAIAIEAGILTKEQLAKKYSCMDGKSFREMIGGMKKTELENGQTREEIINMRAFKEIAQDLQVLARSTPQDKFMLVTGLKEMGMVVAVTGDGTNDAPALKKADVGFAMGICGTEIAKEAADIILLDDNFASIVTAVKWGRNIFTCVRKFLQFQLVINIGAIVIIIINSLICPPQAQPLNTLQLLWVNILMDTFAAMALATEEPSDALLDQRPYSRTDSIFTPVMWRNILGQAFYQIVLFNGLLFYFRYNSASTYDFINQGTNDCDWFKEMSEKYNQPNVRQDPAQPYYNNFTQLYECRYVTSDMPKANYTYFDIVKNEVQYIPDDERITGNADVKRNPGMCRHYAFLFNMYVLLQIFNEINAKKLLPQEINVFKGFFNNFFFIFIILISIVFQVAFVQVEVIAYIMKMRPLSLYEYLVSVGIGASCIIWGYIIKILPLRWFETIQIKEDPMTEEEEANSIKSILRKSHRSQVRDSVRVTREYNDRQSQRVSGRSNRSQRIKELEVGRISSQNQSMRIDNSIAKRTSYQPVIKNENAGRHSLNPDNRE